MTIEIPEFWFWIIVGLMTMNVILSGIEIYYRRKLWRRT